MPYAPPGTDRRRRRRRISISGRGKEFLSTPQGPDRFCGQPSLLSNVYQGLSSGVKRPGREADHLCTSSTEVENGGVITPFSHTSSWCGAQLIKPRATLSFYCTVTFERIYEGDWGRYYTTIGSESYGYSQDRTRGAGWTAGTFGPVSWLFSPFGSTAQFRPWPPP
jgi:hypothetical protein